MMRILVVDDLEENRYMLEVLLQGYGYDVDSASDGVEALKKAAEDDFDMIISDILMPRMDGFQLCREVKKDERLKKIAFVFYTASYTESEDEEFALKLGAESFIVKPTDPDDFVRIVKKVIKDYETGKLEVPEPPIEDEKVYLSEYNERLILKLENKMLELESATKSIKESEEKYKNLIDHANDAVSVIDRTGYISFANPKFCEMTGYSIDEAKKLHFTKLIHPDDKDMATEYFEKRLHGKKAPRNYEVRLLSKTGKTIYIDNNTSIMKKEGRLIGILTIMRDITARKLAEVQVHKLSRAIEQGPAMVVITDTDGNIEFVNPKVTEVTGYSKEELLSKNPRIFQSGKTTKKTYQELWNTILKGETWEGELLNKRKNGELYWESERISPILNNKGKMINYISIKEDITEKIKAREEIIKAKEKAEESDRLKSNFLANMSHELRTPMVGIIGFTEILENEIENPEFKEYASFIHQASNRLMETLNLILNLTKIETEKTKIEFSKIDAIQNIKKTMLIFDKLASNKNIYLKFESAVEKLETETDTRMFDQIISNLVNNAVKYTEKGGITVSVNKVKNNSYLEIKVKDTGIGIPKDKQELIWEEFRQVSEGISRVYEGTGLGLTITNNFVHKLGGQIKLESELDKGATFTVLLPIGEKSISIKTKEPAFDEIIDTPITKDKQEELKTLLYVEDDKISCEVIPLFLKGRYKVECAKNGEEGIEKAKQKIYDGILMDINLQTKMDGIQAAEKIKEMEEYKKVPIIAVTAYAMVGDREKYLEAGFADYISKPFSKNDIIKLLKRTIQEKN